MRNQNHKTTKKRRQIKSCVTTSSNMENQLKIGFTMIPLLYITTTTTTTVTNNTSSHPHHLHHHHHNHCSHHCCYPNHNHAPFLSLPLPPSSHFHICITNNSLPLHTMDALEVTVMVAAMEVVVMEGRGGAGEGE